MMLLLLACAPVQREVETPVMPVVETERLPPPRYGFWGMNGYTSEAGFTDVHTRTGMTVLQTATADPVYAVRTLLPMAKAAGVVVTLRLTKDHAHYTQKGDFDIISWKQRLDVWRESGVQPFIDDGTLAGHMLLDDISNFEGRDPDGDQLDEMARYSQTILPGLMVFIREDATELPVPTSGRFTYLDASVNQYKAAKGDVNDYVSEEVAAAASLGIGVIMGMNIANGGDGSSAQPGWDAGHFAMSAQEITRYGAVLASAPGCGMFLNWEYDGEERWTDGTVGADYFRRPELEAALLAVGAQVAARPGVALRRPR